ncbi:hypothetical protein BJ508DRAFT_194518, partial [Ascobolus immersus RN42]
SKKVGCKFRLTLKRHCKNEPGWHLNLTTPHHNGHPPTPPIHHAQHCRLTVEQLAFVESQTDAGVTASQILASLKERYGNEFNATRKTIYNAQDKLRLRRLNGRTPIQALLDEFR